MRREPGPFHQPYGRPSTDLLTDSDLTRHRERVRKERRALVAAQDRLDASLAAFALYDGLDEAVRFAEVGAEIEALMDAGMAIVGTVESDTPEPTATAIKQLEGAINR